MGHGFVKMRSMVAEKLAGVEASRGVGSEETGPEVEALVKTDRGDAYLIGRQPKTELARINRELRRLRIQIAASASRSWLPVSGT